VRGGSVVAIVLGINALAVSAHAALALTSTIENGLDVSFLILAWPLLAGVFGVATRRTWGPWVSAAALATQSVLFSVYLASVWGRLHGGELLLLGWIAYCAMGLSLVVWLFFVRRA
jgi:hypothetical protein